MNNTNRCCTFVLFLWFFLFRILVRRIYRASTWNWDRDTVECNQKVEVGRAGFKFLMSCRRESVCLNMKLVGQRKIILHDAITVYLCACWHFCLWVCALAISSVLEGGRGFIFNQVWFFFLDTVNVTTLLPGINL